MTAFQFHYFQSTVSNTGSSPLTLNLPNVLPPGSLLLIGVGFGAASQTISSIVIGSGAGTFTRIGTTTGGSRTLELWLGYNFTGYPASYVVTWTGGGTAAVVGTCLFADSDLTVTPTITAGTPTSGTSTTLDSGILTPRAGDLLVAFGVYASTTAPTTRASTGNTFINWTEYAYTVGTTELSLAYAPARGAVSSRLQWTIPSVAWLGQVATLTFASPAAPAAAFVYKGRDSSTADAGTVP